MDFDFKSRYRVKIIIFVAHTFSELESSLKFFLSLSPRGMSTDENSQHLIFREFYLKRKVFFLIASLIMMMI